MGLRLFSSNNKNEMFTFPLTPIVDWYPNMQNTRHPQDTLPPPRAHQVVDWTKNDFELFQKYTLPNGGRCALGDMWDDATGTNQQIQVPTMV